MLDLSEVEELLKFQLEQSTVSAEQLKQYFAELDTDLDGKVSLAEYIASIEQKEAEKEAEKGSELLEAFKMYDRNGNGFIDKHEFMAAMMAMGCMMDAEEVDDIIRGCDEDGDGQINIEEFLEVMGR